MQEHSERIPGQFDAGLQQHAAGFAAVVAAVGEHVQQYFLAVMQPWSPSVKTKAIRSASLSAVAVATWSAYQRSDVVRCSFSASSCGVVTELVAVSSWGVPARCARKIVSTRQ